MKKTFLMILKAVIIGIMMFGAAFCVDFIIQKGFMLTGIFVFGFSIHQMGKFIWGDLPNR